MADTSDPKPQPANDLQAVLARAKGLVQSLDSTNANQEEELLGFDTPLPPPPESGIPVAMPVTGDVSDDVPVAMPVTETSDDLPVAVALPIEPPSAVEPETSPQPDEDLVETVRVTPRTPVAVAPCSICQAPRTPGVPYCMDCGYFFTDSEPEPVPVGTSNGSVAPAPAAPPVAKPLSSTRVKGRYELETLAGERQGVQRYQGRDTGHPLTPNVPVVILRQALAVPAPAVEPEENLADTALVGDEVMPSFDFVTEPATAPLGSTKPRWPSVGWVEDILGAVDSPALPAIVDSFVEGDSEYLVLEVPSGRVLWDAWDDPQSNNRMRYRWLRETAEAMSALHRAGALLEAIRPEMIVVTQDGVARIADLEDLLPLPVPADTPIKGSRYTAPELVTAPGTADARANMYSFGAMLYALHVGRELSDTDFDRAGHPKPFLPRFPDAHPAFGRLMTKTFRRDVMSRFPTDEAGREDASGFKELCQYLDVCGRVFDSVRLEIAAWTTTGIIRTGNEDAFALLHACESRQDDINEGALVFLCDGMGGYEAGEVAAALAIQVMREYLTQQPQFKHFTGAPSFVSKLPGANDGNAMKSIDADACKQIFRATLKETNKQVHHAGRTTPGKRNMGCTAEVVYVDGHIVVVGHVGDSRTYHLHEGQLVQLTRDQTLVNRLVELGTLSADEAENHPRKNELQQAIGGQPDVEPGLYASVMSPGDWIVVCSDGVTNHINNVMLKQMLDSEAMSAEMAARRLVNLVNIEGATDNATVVVIRAT